MGSVTLLQSLKESTLGQASVKTIYGELISAHGKTIIPVAKIMYGYGAGAGTGGAGDASARAVRAFIAVAVVGVFMLITGFMALFPLLSKAQVDLNQYADFFAKTASVYTGIIGVIVGYYFATVEGGISKKAGVPTTTEAPRLEES